MIQKPAKFLALLTVGAGLLTSCTVRQVQMGGAIEFISEGMQLENEPAPYPPDPAILPFVDETGAVQVTLEVDDTVELTRYPAGTCPLSGKP